MGSTVHEYVLPSTDKKRVHVLVKNCTVGKKGKKYNNPNIQGKIAKKKKNPMMDKLFLIKITIKSH